MIRQWLRFGDCTLDVAARELRRGGARVELAPTIFDCIAYLVEHRDRAVGRDELVSAVWGKASISDTMLGKAILAARRAVGDDAQEQAFLRTVPRFGYHWVAAVEMIDGDEANQVVSAPVLTSAASAPTPRRRSPTAALIAIALLLAAAVAWFLLPHSNTSADRSVVVGAQSAPPDSSAILPAEIAAEPADAWLRLGFMDLLATRLRGAGLPVVSSDSVVRIAPEGTAPETALTAVRRAVDVQHLIQPALRKSGAQWFARIEVVDADGSRRSAEAQGDNAIAVANEASERLLALLGRRPASVAPATALTLTELVQRIDAARLSDRMDDARALIAGAPPALAREPEFRMRQIQMDLRAGEFDAARSRVQALLIDVPAETDAVMHGRALESLCVVESRSGHPESAMPACDGAIALLGSRNQPIALGRAYNHRGILHAHQLQREAALADFSRSRVVLSGAGDPLLVAMVDGNESTVQMDFGRPAEALPGIVRAGQQFRRFGMFSESVVSLVNEVEIQLALLQPLAALKAADLSWAERQRIADPGLRHRYAVARADALAANGRLGEARGLYDELLHGADAEHAAPEVAMARIGLARLDLSTHHADSALLLTRQALPALETAEFAGARSVAELTMVRALLQLERRAESAATSTAFGAWAQTIARPEAFVFAQVALAEQAVAEHRDDAAVAAYDAAMQRADGQGNLDIQATAALSYAAYLIDAGNLDRAAVVAGQMARHADDDYDCALLQWRLYRALGRDEAAAQSLARVRRLAGERPVPGAEAPAGLGPGAAPAAP